MVVTQVVVDNGEEGKMMKKGTWTAAEDAVLMEYVARHGEGNWNAVQRNTGLRRCGKSCRLRWANHLRPNLKKGSFSPEEERLVLELHARFGNKWARMASMMPGRTDNEIKNYWNTRMKKYRRQRLPIYSNQYVHPSLSALPTPITAEVGPLPLPFQPYNFPPNPPLDSSFSPSNNSTTFSFQCPTTPILFPPGSFKRFRRSGSDSLLPPLSTVPPATSFDTNAIPVLPNQHPLHQMTSPRLTVSSSSCQLSNPGSGHCEFDRFLSTPSLPPKAPSLPLLDLETVIDLELLHSRKRNKPNTYPNTSIVVDQDCNELLEDLLAESCHEQTSIGLQDENIRLQQLLHPLPLGSNSNNIGYWATSPSMTMEGMNGNQNNNVMHLTSEEATGNNNNQENIDSFEFEFTRQNEREEMRDQINSTGSGDLSNLLGFFPTSEEWFSSGDTSKAQSSSDEPVNEMGIDQIPQLAAESWNEF